jgi:hypothetical protein
MAAAGTLPPVSFWDEQSKATYGDLDMICRKNFAMTYKPSAKRSR